MAMQVGGTFAASHASGGRAPLVRAVKPRFEPGLFTVGPAVAHDTECLTHAYKALVCHKDRFPGAEEPIHDALQA
jgi:hypothetical protein